jgi:hypothetical protein
LFTQADLGEVDGCQAITFPGQEAWMNIHQNARLTPFRRRELVTRLHAGESLGAVAERLGVSVRTAQKVAQPLSSPRRGRTVRSVESAAVAPTADAADHRARHQSFAAPALELSANRRRGWRQ